MEDRRRQQRRQCTGSADIRVRGTSPGSRITTASLYDISAAGMRCAPGIDVESGTPIDIYIFEFMGNPVDFRLTGKVAWRGSGRSEYMGVAFDEEITDERYPLLFAFLCENDADRGEEDL